MNQNDYDKAFKSDPDKLKAAFDRVSDIRKFEIELYWKRAGYFWALIAVAFAGYFAILSSKDIQNKYFLSFVVTSIGFVFTFAWFLVNRGSKYWQENWENHLDHMEDTISGPLYKTILERSELSSLTEKLVTGPLNISVSKINQWVSLFVLFIWLSLAAYSLYKAESLLKISCQDLIVLFSYMAIIILTFCCCIFMLAMGRTDRGVYSLKATERETRIIDEK